MDMHLRCLMCGSAYTYSTEIMEKLSYRKYSYCDKCVDKAIGVMLNAKNNDNAKHDKGKLPLTLVPRSLIRAVARIRQYGVEKYGDPDNWKRVEPERYRDAAFRHFLAYLDDPDGLDEESGLPHLHHLACNIAFLCEMEESKDEKTNLANHTDKLPDSDSLYDDGSWEEGDNPDKTEISDIS